MAFRRTSKNASEEKSKVPRALKTKLSHYQRNKEIKVHRKFSIKVPNSTRESLMMEK